MERRVLSRRYLTYYEARQILEDRLKETGGSFDNPVQERVWDLLRLVGQGDPALARKTVDELKALGIEEYVAVQLVNMCPDEDGYIALILEGQEGLTVTAELLQKIKDVLNPFCSSVSQQGA